MFKKILVPLDGSELAAKILPQVAQLAKLCQAQVSLISVGQAAIAGMPSPELFATMAAHTKKHGELYLQKVAGELQGQGLTVDWVYKEGVPAREIIAYAEGAQVDLIALATHGKGEVAWVMGSTAEKVVSNSPVPVLLMRVIEFKPPLLKEEFFMGA